MIRKKIPRRQAILGLAVLVLTLLILTFYLRHLTETARLGLVQRDLEVRLSRLRDEVKALEAKKAALLSLGRVETVARQDLRLDDPEAGQVIFEGGDGTHK